MDYFGLEEDVLALQARLPSLRASERLEVLVQLAWYLRERDCERCKALVDEAQSLLSLVDERVRCAATARMLLSLADGARAMGQREQASQQLEQALAMAQRVGDPVLLGDAQIGLGRGLLDVNNERRQQAFDAGLVAYRGAGDVVRETFVLLLMAQGEAMRDLPGVEQKWAPMVARARDVEHPSVAGYVLAYEGVLHNARSRWGEAIVAFSRAYEFMLAAGRIPAAIIMASNAGDCAAQLGDYPLGLEWSERALQLAQSRRWNDYIAAGLLNLCETLRRLGRIDAAAAMARDAMGLVTLKPDVRALACFQMSEVSYAMGDFEQALHWSLESERVGAQVNSATVRMNALYSKARALSALGRAAEASQVAEQALCESQPDADRVGGLRVMAEIARRNALPPPPQSSAPSGAVHHLEAALALADSGDGVCSKEDILDELSNDYEAAGDLVRALGCARRAVVTRESTQRKKATDMATVLHVRHETERMRAQAEHHKVLAEAEARRAQAEAKANRAKSAFLANMSHELRSPLNAMLGFTRLLARDEGLPARARGDLGVVLRSGEHLYALINQVLEMSKIESGHMAVLPVAFDLHELLAEIGEMFSVGASNKGLGLQVRAEGDVPRHLRADAVKLRQVLINLLSNALKFTAQGEVAVTVRLREAQAAQCVLVFEVRDSGEGIAEEELAQLGAAFVQAMAGRRAAEGTGLGLAISRGYVQLMGGDLTLRSTPGEGTTVVLELPMQVMASPAASVLSCAPTRYRMLRLEVDEPRRRLLAVDDREEGRQLLVRLLQPLGFEVREACNGAEAVQQWRDWRPSLIFMDMRMPVMDGLQATQAIKAQAQACGEAAPVIVALTASSFEEQRAEILAAGCDDFMRKPFREEALLQLLEQRLQLQLVVREPLAAEPATAATAATAAAVVPEALREQLQHALHRLDVERIEHAIDAITAHDAHAGNILLSMASSFEYHRIENWLGAASALMGA